jgi:hypothetical protein
MVEKTCQISGLSEAGLNLKKRILSLPGAEEENRNHWRGLDTKYEKKNLIFLMVLHG